MAREMFLFRIMVPLAIVCQVARFFFGAYLVDFVVSGMKNRQPLYYWGDSMINEK